MQALKASKPQKHWLPVKPGSIGSNLPVTQFVSGVEIEVLSSAFRVSLRHWILLVPEYPCTFMRVGDVMQWIYIR